MKTSIFRKPLAKILLGTLLGFAITVNAQTKWDLPNAYPASLYITENLFHLAGELEKATGGQLKVTVHPGASLFPANNIKRAVRAGQAQMGELIMSLHGNENPLYGLDSVPFLATGYKDSYKLWQVSREATEKMLDKEGLKLLYAIPWPPQGLYSKTPITKIADLKGMKWRAYNPATSKIAELVGAQPVTVQMIDLAQALATGSINSMMTSAATGVDIKVWESMKYYYEVDAWLPKDILIVNKKAFESLDKKTQDTLVKQAAEAEKRGWKLSEERNKVTLEILRKNGMIAEKPSAQLKEELVRQVGDVMTKDWLAAMGGEGNSIIQNFKK
jgi:TRAP-type C4-dicarboxylate transport system substrate-binding protein